MRIQTTWRRVVLAGLVLVACEQASSVNSNLRVPANTTPSQVDGDAGGVLLQESFEDNSFAARGWYDNTGMATTAAQHLAGSARALEVHFPAGATTPTWGGAARHLFPATPTLYIGYWVKYSSNWVGSGRSYHPHEFLVLSDQDADYDGPSNNWLALYLEHNYQNGGIPRLSLQDNKAINTSYGSLPRNLIALTESRSTAGCNGLVEAGVVATCFSMPPWYNDKEISAAQVAFRPTPGPGYKGDWNHVEAYYQLNSVAGGVGQPDGVMQYWFNGVLIIDRHDILFRTGARPNIKFHQLLISPYIGDGSPVDQSLWVDDLTLAASRLAGAAPAVASVTVSPASATAAVGGSTQFVATLRDASGTVLTGPAVTWASGTTAVATVSPSGLAAAVAPGTATITATSGGKSGAATLAVAASQPGTVTDLQVTAVTDSSVTLTFTEAPNGLGGPATYDIRRAVGALSWGSAADVALGTCAVPLPGTTVGSARSCTVLGLSAATTYQFQLIAFRGTLNVDAVFGALSNVAGATTAAPAARVASVTVAPASAGLALGVTQQFTATLRDAAGNILTGRTVAWTSSNTAVATVSASGAASGIAAGATTIHATNGGVTGSAAVTVTAPVASVTVTPSSVSQSVGATRQLTATLKDASGAVLTGRAVTWASSAPAVATVSGSGLETGVAAGTVTITASSEGSRGAAAITVTAALTNPGKVTDLAVAGVTTSAVTLSFKEVSGGNGLPASYLVRSAAGPLSWGSAADVAQGTCKAPLPGATVGATRSCTVLDLAAATGYQFQLVAFRGTLNVDAVFGALSNVASTTTAASTPAPVATVTLSPASASLMVAGTQQLAALLKDASGTTLTGRPVTWASSAALVASVSGGGVVTGLLPGTTTITATSEGRSGTATITVTALPPPPPPGGTWANEPAGFTLLTDYGFTDPLPLVNDGPVGSGWKILNPDNGQPLVAGHAVAGVDPTAPLGAAIGQFVYPIGMRDGWAPATMYYAGFNASELYAGFWWKPSSPWQTDRSGVNKIAFVFGGPAQIYISMHWNGAFYHLRVEDEINAPTTNYDPNVTLTPITLGQWHKIEWTVSRTGGLQFWLDGLLQGRYPAVRWASPFTMFQFSPTWGGNGGDVKTELDSFSYNHVHLSRH